MSIPSPPPSSSATSAIVEVRSNPPEGSQETSRKNRRGVTKGISVMKKWQQSEKLNIVIHPHQIRIVGQNAKDFKTEACVVIKQHAPLEYARWKDIPADSKENMWLAMKQKFDMSEEVHVKKVVFGQLNRQYRSYRHKLHMHYLKNKDDDNLLAKYPYGVSGDTWKLLINYFESDDFLKVSGRNKENRTKLTMVHTGGSKSIAQYYYENHHQTGEDPTRTSMWRRTRCAENNEWIVEHSGAAYDNIIRLQGVREDGQVPKIEDNDVAFIEAHGSKKRLCICGDDLKPPSKRNNHRAIEELQRENEELKKQFQKDKETLIEMSLRLKFLESEIVNQKAQVQSQVQEILQAQLPSMLKKLVQSDYQIP